MATNTSDPREKTIAATVQLRDALVKITGALETIIDAIPGLLPPVEENTAAGARRQPTSASLQINHQDESSVPPTSNKRKRKEKDPDAPEKPASAYHLYVKEKRDEIKAAMPGQPTGNEVVQEINRLWKGLSEELKKPFIDAAEKLKGPYKQAMAEYERRMKGASDDKHDSGHVENSTELPPVAKAKPSPAKGGFTAVKAAPLVVNLDGNSDSEDDSQDEAAVAADLGGSQAASSVSPTKRQKKDTAKGDDDSPKKGKKEKTKDKDKKKRRKSSKTDSQ